MKYFITSDIHSFYTPLMDSLKSSGFDINNPEHILVVNGDLFDRGGETVQLLEFIKSLPKERRILIRGNHEYLLKELIETKWLPESYDYSNGTVRTCYDLYTNKYKKSSFIKIFNKMYDKMNEDIIYKKYSLHLPGYNFNETAIAQARTFNYIAVDIFNDIDKWAKVANYIKKSGLIDWIFNSGEWVDYFELGNYIITHSFIPIEIPMTFKWGEYFPVGEPKYMPNWRECKDSNIWNKATWGCPYRDFDEGYFNEEIKNNKILVCGHWHCADFHIHYEQEILNEYSIKAERNEYKENEINQIYYGDNLIAIDGCTIVSDIVNVLVIDDKDFKVYDQHQQELNKEISKGRLIRKYPKIETITESQLLKKRDEEEGLT